MAERFKFISVCVSKTWKDPNDREQGINIDTWNGYHKTAKEAAKHIKQIRKEHPEAVHFFGYYTPVTMVAQVIKA